MFALPPTSTLFPYTTLFRSPVDRRLVHRDRQTAACLGDPAHHLGRVPRAPRGIAGIHPLGREGQEEVLPHLKEIGRHTSELQSPVHLVCRLLLEKKNSRRRN